MKKLTLFSLIFLSQFSFSQVAINNDGTDPYISAILDLKSTTKGILIPRMTANERDNISPVTEGLTVFITDDNNYYYYDGNKWISMKNDNDWLINGDHIYNGNSGFVGIGIDSPEGILHVAREDEQRRKWPIFSVATNKRAYRSNIVLRKSRGTIESPEAIQEDDVIATYDTQAYDGDSYVWTSNFTVTVDGNVSDNIIPSRINLNVTDVNGKKLRSMVLKSNGYVGIGNTSPQGALDISSTTGALVVPRMTEAERNALPQINGSIIYNTDTNEFNFFENGAWITKN